MIAKEKSALATQFFRDHVVVEETGSTNADVAELARAGRPEGLVLVAEHQTAGRGRLGRDWTAPRGSGLTFSVLLRPTGVAAKRWPLLPLLVGVGVVEAVRRVARVDAVLKWPNDVLVGDRKLGGILAERVDTPDGPAAVVGVGLNLALQESELPVPTAISLTLAGAVCTDRDIVLQAVLQGVAAHYLQWRDAAGDAGHVLPAYRALCATLGRAVRVELPGGEYVEGVADDIDAAGGLVVVSPAARRVVTAGDVVHVR